MKANSLSRVNGNQIVFCLKQLSSTLQVLEFVLLKGLGFIEWQLGCVGEEEQCTVLLHANIYL